MLLEKCSEDALEGPEAGALCIALAILQEFMHCMNCILPSSPRIPRELVSVVGMTQEEAGMGGLPETHQKCPSG